MQQIADWLEKLGMSEYAERFAENDIDVSVLRHLTDQDLKDIGVLLGHRRKMLAAIAELGGAVPASPQPTFTEQIAEHLTDKLPDLPQRMARRNPRLRRYVRKQPALILKCTPHANLRRLMMEN
jgi:hypothetical protein